MANHPSAEKRNRQREKRAARNLRLRSALRTTVKKARAAIASGNKAEAKALVLQACRALAQATSKGILPKNTAARTTSRIQSALNKLGA